MKLLLFFISVGLGVVTNLPSIEMDIFSIFLFSSFIFLMGIGVAFLFNDNLIRSKSGKADIKLVEPINFRNVYSVSFWLGVGIMLFAITNLIFTTSLIDFLILSFGVGIIFYIKFLKNPQKLKDLLTLQGNE